jgi:hypothetical protein
MNHFKQDYIGRKVLVQTNEQDTDFIPAIIDGVDFVGVNGNIAMIRFRAQSDNHQFFCGSGAVYPDTEDFRAILDFISKRFPKAKDKFAFLAEIKNYYSDMHYIAKNSFNS